ncbi:MAG: hypothetical protein L3J71_00815 [Victivallaceae bacterium]|nr:hypothetical protein [Victivallaceae bacterium]
MRVHGRLVHNRFVKKKKIDTTLYVKAVKAKISLKRFILDFSYEHLLQLREATKNIDNPAFRDLLEKIIKLRTKKGNKFKATFSQLGENKKDISSFSKATGLKTTSYNNYSSIKFKIKRSGKFSYIRNATLENNTVLRSKSY